MPHGVNTNEELAVAALLNFGTTGSGQEDGSPSNGSSNGVKDGAVAAAAHNGKKASTKFFSNIQQDQQDAKSVAVVTVGEQSSSSDISSKEGMGEVIPKRPLDDPNHNHHNGAATVVSSDNSKRARVEGYGNEVSTLPRTDPKDKNILIIQDCHAVLGDRHCAGRTTIATVILREIKLEYKDKYKGKGVDNWYGEAMTEYYKRVKERVPGFSQEDYETVLVYSYSPKGRKKERRADSEIGSNRVERPNCYKYACDDIPKYGKAKVPEAVKFFFNSKDAPTLPKEISKYRSDFNKLKMSTDQPPAEKVKFFEDFLKFCEENLQKSKDEEMASQLLHSLNLIPTLRRLWDTLKNSSSGDKPSSKLSKGPETVAQKMLRANKRATPPTTTAEVVKTPEESLQVPVDSQTIPAAPSPRTSGIGPNQILPV